MAVHQIGIRELVEFLLRTGDLSPVVTSENTAQEAAGFTEKSNEAAPQLINQRLPSKRLLSMKTMITSLVDVRTVLITMMTRS